VSFGGFLNWFRVGRPSSGEFAEIVDLFDQMSRRRSTQPWSEVAVIMCRFFWKLSTGNGSTPIMTFSLAVTAPG
jgi:hypothetical protein